MSGSLEVPITRQEIPATGAEAKLNAVRRAVDYDFPVGAIEEMLAEVEPG